MGCDITNNSDMNIDDLSPLIDDLASHIQNKMKMKSVPAITMQDDPKNANTILGKTAQYDPQNKVITVFVTSRHPKDIMRSISHEMIHHVQNERGDFDNIGAVGEGYAQSDDHLRNMEKEAYLKGNMCFRDWEDGYKKQMMESIHRQNSFKRRNNTMKIHKWKNNELNRLLMEKFNLGEGTYNREEEEEEEVVNEDAYNRDEEEEEEVVNEDAYNRDDDDEDEAVNEDLGKAEEELKAKIKQAEAEGDKKKAEELKKQLQQMGGNMQEGELPQALKAYNDKKKDDEEKSEKEEDVVAEGEDLRQQIRNKIEEILKIK